MIEPIPSPSLRNIILIGIMGCGKTSIGKEISKQTNLPLVDIDSLIEGSEGKTINEIFASKGEAYFRMLETNALKELSRTAKQQVISTGGGIIINPENRNLLPKLGYVVWLDANIDTLYERIIRQSTRPLLNTPNAREMLIQLHEQRKPWYKQCAHLSIETSLLTVEEVAIGIIESARFYFHKQSKNSP